MNTRHDQNNDPERETDRIIHETERYDYLGCAWFVIGAALLGLIALFIYSLR